MDLFDIAVAKKLAGGGGGGGGEISPFFHKQVDVPNTTSTTPANIEEVQLPDGWTDGNHILYFVSRYVGTVPNSHYVGSEVVGVHAVYSTIDSFAFGGCIMRMDANGQIVYSSSPTLGVFPQMNSGKLYLKYCYSNATTAIGGTYDVKIYMIPKPIQTARKGAI